MQELIDTFLALSENVRYVAIFNEGQLTRSIRAKLAHASGSESDKYEELIVNPTILTLVTQRGNIDCGGAEFVLVRYGYFYQLIIPRVKGHVSICIEPEANPLELIEPIRQILSQNDAD